MGPMLLGCRTTLHQCGAAEADGKPARVTLRRMALWSVRWSLIPGPERWGFMPEFLISYLMGVVALLTVAAGIVDEDVTFTHIVIAALGWPLFAPVLLWQAWTSR